jgi:hypothetical protein
MRTFPATCAGAIRSSQIAAERAREKVKGLVVVASNGSAFFVSQRKPQSVKDSDGPATMATAVTLRGLAQIVEQSDYGNAVGRVTASVR